MQIHLTAHRRAGRSQVRLRADISKIIVARDVAEYFGSIIPINFDVGPLEQSRQEMTEKDFVTHRCCTNVRGSCFAFS